MIDVAIVGGGPAGQTAAERLSGRGLRVAMVDEQMRPGGQILRQPPADFQVDRWLPGRGYRALKARLARFEVLHEVTWLGGQSVIGVARSGDGFALTLASAAGARRLDARRVLIATGCYDLPVPLPGWTIPGVMTAGAVQAFVKGQRIVPGRRFVLAGTHPLMLIVAAQVVEAGGEVAGVFFDQPLRAIAGPTIRQAFAAARHLGHFAEAAGARLALARAGVPVRFGLPLVAVEGRDAVTGARFDDGMIACDRVALCYGFVPQSDLPRQAGASVAWSPQAGGWRTRCNAWMESDVAGLFVAGETTGVAGAEIAALEGDLAGLGLLCGLGMADVESIAAPIRARLRRAGTFAALLAEIADPHAVLARTPPADTVLCRCENVTIGAIDATQAFAGNAHAVKLATRCGMGVCQGRVCEGALLRRIAAATGQAVETQAGFTARFPARPVPVGDLVRIAPDATN